MPQLGDVGQQRDQAPASPGPQQRRGGPGVVPSDHRRLHDLAEGVPPGLAALQLDQVKDLGLALEQQVVKAQQDLGAPMHRGGRPRRLRGPGAVGRRPDVVGGAGRDPAQDTVVAGRVDRDHLGAGRLDPACQAIKPVTGPALVEFGIVRCLLRSESIISRHLWTVGTAVTGVNRGRVAPRRTGCDLRC